VRREFANIVVGLRSLAALSSELHNVVGGSARGHGLPDKQPVRLRSVRRQTDVMVTAVAVMALQLCCEVNQRQ